MSCPECLENQTIQEDIEYLAKVSYPWKSYVEKSILVTGATGLIGAQMVYLLACLNRMKDASR